MSEEEDLQDILKVLDNFGAQLQEIEDHLVPLLNPELPLREISQQISHLDNAKLYSGLAYALHTLFFSMCWHLPQAV